MEIASSGRKRTELRLEKGWCELLNFSRLAGQQSSAARGGRLVHSCARQLDNVADTDGPAQPRSVHKPVLDQMPSQ